MKVLQAPMNEPGLNHSQEERVLILSAADRKYWRTLWQMLLSAERVGLHHTCAWRIYDLGMDAEQVAALQKRFSWIEIRKFEFDKYPPHVQLPTYSYAWKAILVADEVADHRGIVFWFDSATLFHSKLEHPLAIVDAHGFWALKCQSPLVENCHAEVLDALQVPYEVRHLAERASGALGFDCAHGPARKLVADWKQCALVRDYILPAHNGRPHGRDQAVFSALLLKQVAEGSLTLTHDEIDLSSPRPTKDITTRNKVKPDAPLWQDPWIRLYHRIYKTADQLNHRWRRFLAARRHGKHPTQP